MKARQSCGKKTEKPLPRFTHPNPELILSCYAWVDPPILQGTSSNLNGSSSDWKSHLRLKKASNFAQRSGKVGEWCPPRYDPERKAKKESPQCLPDQKQQSLFPKAKEFSIGLLATSALWLKSLRSGGHQKEATKHAKESALGHLSQGLNLSGMVA
uniref:Uncharacterized protein n=1 Tax=Sphaerodactylus townsendi TaxID=933632 RepID=A0ACB8FRK5_9SAUR